MKILDHACNGFEIDENVEYREKFYTNKGWLNQYALMCGYQEQLDFWGENDSEYTSARLYSEGSCYHVRFWDQTSGTRVWDSYCDLEVARKAFRVQAEMVIFYNAGSIGEFNKHSQY